MSRRFYSGILALGLGLAEIVGYAEANPEIYHPSEQRQEEPQQSKLTEAQIMQILGLSNRKEIAYLPQGYVTSRGIRTGLLTIAGVYGGEIEVKRKVEGNKIKYSLKSKGLRKVFENSPHFMKAVADADTSRDKIITIPEIKDLKLRVFKAYAR